MPLEALAPAARARFGAGAVIVCGALWGAIGPVMVEMQHAGASSPLIAFLRIGIAALALGAFTLARFGLRAFRVDARTLAFCALLGVVCHGIYNALYVSAVELGGVAVSAVLLRTAPVFTLGVGLACATERATRAKALGIAIDIIGCVLVVLGNQTGSVSFSVQGIAFGLGAAVAYALNPILSSAAGRRANPFVVTTYSFLFGAVALVFWLAPWSTPLSLNGAIVGWGIVLALVPTALGYLLYYIGAGLVDGSSKLPVLASLETPLAAVLGVVLYHESLGAVGAIGIALVLASIALMGKQDPARRNKEPRDEAPRKVALPEGVRHGGTRPSSRLAASRPTRKSALRTRRHSLG